MVGWFCLLAGKLDGATMAVELVCATTRTAYCYHRGVWWVRFRLAFAFHSVWILHETGCVCGVWWWKKKIEENKGKPTDWVNVAYWKIGNARTSWKTRMAFGYREHWNIKKYMSKGFKSYGVCNMDCCAKFPMFFFFLWQMASEMLLCDSGTARIVMLYRHFTVPPKRG